MAKFDFRSSQASYADDGISYVQLRRTVKSKISPEHRIRAKLYAVTSVVDEKNYIIYYVECHVSLLKLWPSLCGLIAGVKNDHAFLSSAIGGNEYY